jgi:hypothetical protein
MNTNETILENLKYGNLTFKQEEELKTHKSLFTNYVDFFTNEPYPNVFETTKEIKNLKFLMEDKIKSENWNEVKELITQVDINSFDVLEMYITELGIDFKSDYLMKVRDKLYPFILSLKKFYNRPRPFQFSYYTNQGLHPLESKTAHTPSYPSGHALQNYFLCKVIAFHNPDKKNEIIEVADIIAKTREVLGVHYKSDNLFSKYIVDELVKVKEIKDIYFNEKKLG